MVDDCRNVIPQLRNWHEQYKQSGLTIVGVHSPEFAWEKPWGKVKTTVEKLSIKYPVVQDNNFEIWKRYGIWAWPTIVLVDKKGIIRYRHIGEGSYDKTESTLRQLLSEHE
ncbi:MAG: redoxin domain-containing protein [Candidatus Binatia bacterium]